MQRNSVKHVLNRFQERITKTKAYQKIYITNHLLFDEEDYNLIWKICKDNSIGSNLTFLKRNGKAKSYKKIIFYKELPMWVVFTSRQKKPKTIYSVNDNILRKINK